VELRGLATKSTRRAGTHTAAEITGAHFGFFFYNILNEKVRPVGLSIERTGRVDQDVNMVLR
jgi:hypothetical protein